MTYSMTELKTHLTLLRRKMR
jgi:hypothetical protein